MNEDLRGFIETADNQELIVKAMDNNVKHEDNHTVSCFIADIPEVEAAEILLRGLVRPEVSYFCYESLSYTSDCILLKDKKSFFPLTIYPEYFSLYTVPHHPYFIKGCEYKAFREIKVDKAFIIEHCHSHLFGHFLIECVYKIFQLKDLYDAGFRVPVVLRATSPSYVKQYIDLLIPNCNFIFMQTGDLLFIDRVYSAKHYSYYKWPRAIVIKFRALSKKFHTGCDKKIFVSRDKVKSNTNFRVLENSKEIEKIVKDYGYKVVYPESMAIEEQVALFANAEVVVGEFGSGLHNTIYSGIGTKVVSLNWINLVQQSIGLNFGQENIFLAPVGGLALAPDTESGIKRYTFDIDVFTDILAGLEK